MQQLIGRRSSQFRPGNRVVRAAALVAALLVLGGADMAYAGVELSRTAFITRDDDARTVVAVHEAPSPPEIDGVLDESWWPTARVAEAFADTDAANRTRLKLAYDQEAIYLAAICYVDEPDALKREVQPDEDGSVWHDDCIDFKFSADGGASERQLLVNANGAIQANDRNVDDEDWAREIRAGATVTDEAYIVEIALPREAIGLDPEDRTIAFTFGRADRTQPWLELSTAFGEEWGAIQNNPPLLMLGDAPADADTETDLEIERFALYTDRAAYPSFERAATGRVVMESASAGEDGEAPGRVQIQVRDGEERLLQETQTWAAQARALDFDLDLDLEPGEYTVDAAFLNGDEELASDSRSMRVYEREVQRSGEIDVTVPAGRAEAEAWPITFGVPFPWGALDSTEQIKLLDGDGAEVPIETEVAERWSREGSLRWVHVHTVVPIRRDEQSYTLVFGPDVERGAVTDPLKADESADEMHIESARLRMSFSHEDGQLDRVARRDADGSFTTVQRADDMSGPYMVDDAGEVYRGRLDPEADLELEAIGPLRAVVRASGYHVSEDGEKLGRYELRYHLWRDVPFVQLDHTFIITHDAEEARYRDIGHTLPLSSRDYWFGSPPVHHGTLAADESAYLLQHDDQRFSIYEDGAFKDEGARADGWLTAGRGRDRLTLAVRDFWQQFPKQLKVTRDHVHVHFWAPDNDAPRREGDRISNENAHLMWFAHEGPVLDFTVPDLELDLFAPDTLARDVEQASVANPVGMAKTHQLMLYFHAEDWVSAEAHSRNRLFQQEPTGVVDPHWIAGTEVMGRLSARDPERFPEVERALDSTFELIQRYQKLDRDYGMFNFGDSHHSWNDRERRWSLHRIWYQTHHGWPRWPWIMYARSGKQEHLRWARRNARHVADVVHARYAPERFEDVSPPRRKILGGKHDYKGFVHWNRGDRIGYNSVSDALLWHHHLTGDMRSRETALDHARAVVDDAGRMRDDRAGAGRITTAIAAYWHTWDNDYLEFIDRHVAHQEHMRETDPARFQRGRGNFAPYLQRYVELTGDQDAKDAMVRWGEYHLEHQHSWLRAIDVPTHAYFYGGDERHLRRAAEMVSRFTDIYEGDDPRHRGSGIRDGAGHLQRSYFMQQAPYYLRAVQEHGSKPEPLPDQWAEIRALSSEEIDGEDRYVFRARIRMDDPDAAFTLRPAVTRGGAPLETQRAMIRPVGGGDWITSEPVNEPELSGHYWTDDGRVPASKDAEFELTVPSDGQREYELKIHAEVNFHVRVPLARDEPSIREVYPQDSGYEFPGHMPFYFAFPASAESVRFEYRARPSLASFDLFDPQGQRVLHDAWVEANTDAHRRAKMELKDRDREDWSFRIVGHHSARVEAAHFDDNAMPFYFSVSPEKWFDPMKAETSE